MTLHDIQNRLGLLSTEMSLLIRKYEMSAESALQVIQVAREAISCPEDYIRFLELSLEGRILADEGERLMKAEEASKERGFVQ